MAMAIIGFLFLIGVGIFFMVQGVRMVGALGVIMQLSGKLEWAFVAFTVIAFVIAAAAFIAAISFAPFELTFTPK
jgi:hypothetical protein